MISYIIWATIIVLAVIMLRYYSKRLHPVRSALFGMFSGAAAFALLYFFGSRIGVYADLNFFNISLSLILGIPGAVLILILNMV